jgi:hypothetical protein
VRFIKKLKWIAKLLSQNLARSTLPRFYRALNKTHALAGDLGTRPVNTSDWLA